MPSFFASDFAQMLGVVGKPGPNSLWSAVLARSTGVLDGRTNIRWTDLLLTLREARRRGLGSAAASFAVVVLIVTGAVGLTSMQIGTSSKNGTGPERIVLPTGTTLKVSSSYDCVAGHYEVPFVAQGYSVPFEAVATTWLPGELGSGYGRVALIAAVRVEQGDYACYHNDRDQHNCPQL